MEKQNRFKRICPVCGKENLKYLSKHLQQVHSLSSVERKPFLKIAKYQGITVYRDNVSIPKVPYSPKIKLAARAKGVAKNRSSKLIVKQPVKRKLLQAIKSWKSHRYPEFQLKHPFSIMVVGPTSCGKTHFVMELLESSKMKDFNIEWNYNQYQQTYTDFQRAVGKGRVKLSRGLPKYNDEDLRDLNPVKKTVIVIDDLMEEAKNSKLVSKLFTQGRHRNVSVILIMQNAFPKGKYNTEIARNAMYMALFKSPADREQISRLGHKMFEKVNNVFMQIYRNVTNKKYGYVLIDNTPEMDADHQIVSDIFTECKRYVIVNSQVDGKETGMSKETSQNEDDKQEKHYNMSTMEEPMNLKKSVQQADNDFKSQRIDNFFQVDKLPSRKLLNSVGRRGYSNAKPVILNSVGRRGYSNVIRGGIGMR